MACLVRLGKGLAIVNDTMGMEEAPALAPAPVVYAPTPVYTYAPPSPVYGTASASAQILAASAYEEVEIADDV